MKNTKKGISVLICGAVVLLSGAQGMPTVPREMGPYWSTPASRQVQQPATRTDASWPATFLPEYSVFSRNEATVQHLRGALVQAMADGGYQPGWQQLVNGQGVETWYHRGLDQTVMSVRWSTEAGYVQSTFRQPGPQKTGEVRGSGAPGDPAPAATLEDTLQAFDAVVTPGNADQAASAEEVYQQRHQGLVAFLQHRGFRPTWIRESSSEGTSTVAWYHPALNMTVVYLTRSDRNGHAQTVLPFPGRLRSTVFLPAD